MVLPDELDQFIDAMAPVHSEVQAEMAAEAADRGFPIIGRAAGGFLQATASTREATAVFEFGSGFGYSGTWFQAGMSVDGHLILTERDRENVRKAEQYLNRSGDGPTITVETGDALEIVQRYDGPFDVVLLDHDKAAYPTGFERVHEKVAPGGVVIADNILRGPVAYEEILPYVTDSEADTLPDDDTAAGLVTYLRRVRSHEGYDTVVLPIGNGLAVSAKR